MRDIDRIVQAVTDRDRAVVVTQLEAGHPDDDDGIWFFRHPESQHEVQLESSTGSCPFLVETEEHDEREEVHSVEDAVAAVFRVLRPPPRPVSGRGADLPRGVTGFDPGCVVDVSSFRTACHDAARAVGGKVVEFHEAGVTPNFHVAIIEREGGASAVLCNQVHGLVAVADPLGPGDRVLAATHRWRGDLQLVGLALWGEVVPVEIAADVHEFLRADR